MSLDFYLVGPLQKVPCTCVECFNIHERETHDEYFTANITHNLNSMFEEAGCYDILWHGDGKRAGECLATLRAGLAKMKANPDHFKKFDSPNGWGLYVHAVPWLENVIAACEKYPTAYLQCSR